ncbi:MAG TPA: hypothetical protein ENK35_06485 [Candidatus Tenderia sp.]|nr:hypothetical protein [Candidatus Tenderia sp.]
MMLQRPSNLRHKQQGLTLVELMISVTLSLIIMAGIFQIFMSSKQTYRVQDALGRVQENARFAMDLLTYDIRMAGNVGCNRNAILTNQFAGIVPDINSGIQGFDIAGGEASMFTMMTDADNNLTADDIVNNSDAIFIQGASSVSGDLSAAMANSNAPISVNRALTGVEAGDLVIIADCTDAEIFQVTNINADLTQITHNGLNKTYGTDAQVMPAIYTAYYLATDDNGVQNLYQRSIGAVTGALAVQAEVPLIEGVEDMQIFYGETIGNTIAYNTANNVADMANVTSVRIHLLLATLEDNLTGQDHRIAATPPQNYWYVDANGNNVQVAVRDNRLFRAMTTTISLRN